MPDLLPSLPVTSWLALPGALPVWGAAAAVAVGAAYLFFGARLFRLLMVAAGALLGAELGRQLAVGLELPVPWVAVPLSVILGGLAWPLWQLALFLLGGAVTALAVGEVLAQALSERMQILYGIAAAFLVGGALSLALVRAMTIGITAILGAGLVWAGGVCLLSPHAAFVARLPELPAVSGALIGVLALAGMVAQAAQPDPKERRRMKVEEAAERVKARQAKDSQKAYERYLGT